MLKAVIKTRTREERVRDEEIEELLTIIRALIKKVDYLNSKKSIWRNDIELYNVFIDSDYIKSGDYIKGDVIGYGIDKRTGARLYFTREDLLKLYQI